MIFYLLFVIVFIAEIIIAVTIFLHLYKWHTLLKEWNDMLTVINPQIKNIVEICRKISEQLTELAYSYVSNFKLLLTNLFFDNIINIISGLLFWKANKSLKYLKNLKN